MEVSICAERRASFCVYFIRDNWVEGSNRINGNQFRAMHRVNFSIVTILMLLLFLCLLSALSFSFFRWRIPTRVHPQKTVLAPYVHISLVTEPLSVCDFVDRCREVCDQFVADERFSKDFVPSFARI